MRWAILRTTCFYPVPTHNKIIAACCLLHHLIRNEIEIDSLEEELDENLLEDENVNDNKIIDTIESSNA